ncbi:MAG: hypothetical protein Q8927_19515 [Bacteroidota bacterium]|nr:hypothetical protein [Bacteroidota bacterium]MDP4218393.1 hypothetical protein [Bacteroidota bacterium]MDP4245835.1 hypothetical protein [Bacteroidota bacterium]MDP4252655.1 hypothetical protein [Bacteroidota bacterium]MDP4256678.1 hypothetical protein [Bacteroidota bacterium]
MSYILITYSCYLVITVILTIWVARTLFRNGKIFLVDIFHGNTALAQAVNNLLLVGFYLVNIGYAVYTLSITRVITNTTELVEILSLKVGAIILILGGMHFFNMLLFFKLRRRALQEKRLRTTHFTAPVDTEAGTK